jgi:hypothetical protein
MTSGTGKKFGIFCFSQKDALSRSDSHKGVGVEWVTRELSIEYRKMTEVAINLITDHIHVCY